MKIVLSYRCKIHHTAKYKKCYGDAHCSSNVTGIYGLGTRTNTNERKYLRVVAIISMNGGYIVG